MKKEKKFLEQLEKNLEFVSKRDKTAIVLKYQKIIDEKKENKVKIVSILKELGTPEEVAQREIEEYRKTRNAEYSINKFFSRFKKDKTKDKKKDNKKKEEPKKEKDESKVGFFQKLKNKKENKEKKEKVGFFARLKEKKENKEKKSFFDRFKKKKTIKEKIEEEIEEHFEEEESEIAEVAEIVTEKKIFETKEERIKRITLRTIGVIFTIILIFIWLWVCVLFIATVFAFLDGVKLYGMVVAMGGLTMLILSIIIVINGSLFRRKIRRLWPFLFIILFVAITACGIALFVKEIYKIKVTSDVSEKYNMTKKTTSYNLPSDPEKRLFITFNSNYKTDYIIEYDKTITDKVNVEVKYFECYYDYFAKKDSNNLYISLGLDNRDRLSVYIDDLKEGKIYDNKELERYVVKITYNEKDKDRIVIK